MGSRTGGWMELIASPDSDTRLFPHRCIIESEFPSEDIRTEVARMKITAYLQICLLFALLILSTVPCSGSIGGHEALMKISTGDSGDYGLICGTGDEYVIEAVKQQIRTYLWWLLAIVAVVVASIKLPPLIGRAMVRREYGNTSALPPDDSPDIIPNERTE